MPNQNSEENTSSQDSKPYINSIYESINEDEEEYKYDDDSKKQPKTIFSNFSETIKLIREYLTNTSKEFQKKSNDIYEIETFIGSIIYQNKRKNSSKNAYRLLYLIVKYFNNNRDIESICMLFNTLNLENLEKNRSKYIQGIIYNIKIFMILFYNIELNNLDDNNSYKKYLKENYIDNFYENLDLKPQDYQFLKIITSKELLVEKLLALEFSYDIYITSIRFYYLFYNETNIVNDIMISLSEISNNMNENINPNQKIADLILVTQNIQQIGQLKKKIDFSIIIVNLIINNHINIDDINYLFATITSDIIEINIYKLQQYYYSLSKKIRTVDNNTLLYSFIFLSLKNQEFLDKTLDKSQIEQILKFDHDCKTHIFLKAFEDSCPYILKEIDIESIFNSKKAKESEIVNYIVI